jgi:type II secretory pathway pseudopilin PulG
MLRRRAFTLIEAITAILILGISMPAMLMALTNAHRSRVTPIRASQARWLAMEKLEDVIADRASPTRGWEYIIASNFASEATVPGVAGYARAVSITETGSDLVTPGEGYKTIEVTVSWVHEESTSLSVTLATVLTELPE